MADREKVINALQQCVGYEDDDNKYTCIYDGDINPNCPYGGTGGDGVSCMTKMMRDALALLKAQEPRVMTLWEAVGIIDRPVYLERNVIMPDKSVNRQECWALVRATDDEHMIMLATPYGEEKWHVGAYGIGWRCWTSRPTDEQREAVKWE